MDEIYIVIVDFCESKPSGKHAYNTAYIVNKKIKKYSFTFYCILLSTNYKLTPL